EDGRRGRGRDLRERRRPCEALRCRRRREVRTGDGAEVDREGRGDDRGDKGRVGPVVHCPRPKLRAVEAETGEPDPHQRTRAGMTRPRVTRFTSASWTNGEVRRQRVAWLRAIPDPLHW